MRFNRLRQLTAAELRWRGGAAWRTAAERLSALTTPRWDRADLSRVLSPASLDPGLRAAIAAHRWPEVNDTLAARLASRPARYVLDPHSTRRLRDAVLARWPDAAQDAVARADRMLHGEYDVLGYRGLAFRRGEAGVDWHFDPVHNRRAPQAFWASVPYLDPAVGDHKIIWELNRHHHWMRFGRALWLTGDSKYAGAIVSELESWLAANPPLIGINWASMLEVGLRSLSWTWALHCLLGDRGSGLSSPWLVDMFIGLDRQLTHIERHLSYYFSPNTHLTGEALALYVAGTALPELAGSGRWAATGRRILIAEIDRQIHTDGGHAEGSTHYQRYTLDFYLLALLTARLSHDDEAARIFADAARRLAEFTRTMADDHGRLPLIGDDDGGMLWPLRGRACNDVRDSLSVAAVALSHRSFAPWGPSEETLWIGGVDAQLDDSAGRPAPARSRALAQTGYFVARDGHGGHAVLDGGRHGYMNGGHAHADALAITLSIDGRPLLVDPGTSTYTVNPRLRDRMRSSVSHNTVTLDGRPQSAPGGPFDWRTRADAVLHAWRHNEAFDWVEASHDGYRPARHRRTLLRSAGEGWLVADEILGNGRHAADAYWHFDPAWSLAVDGPGRLRATHMDGRVVWLLHDGDAASLFHGDEESGLGWYAPVYGTLLPTWTARVTRNAVAPFSLATWIGSSESVPSLTRQATDADTSAIAVRVDRDSRTSLFVVRPGGGEPPLISGSGTVQVAVGPAFADLKDRDLMRPDVCE